MPAPRTCVCFMLWDCSGTFAELGEAMKPNQHPLGAPTSSEARTSRTPRKPHVQRHQVEPRSNPRKAGPGLLSLRLWARRASCCHSEGPSSCASANRASHGGDHGSERFLPFRTGAAFEAQGKMEVRPVFRECEEFHSRGGRALNAAQVPSEQGSRVSTQVTPAGSWPGCLPQTHPEPPHGCLPGPGGPQAEVLAALPH